MGVISVNAGSQSASIGVEHSLAQVSGVGVYVLRVDNSAMITGDTLEVRVKVPATVGSEVRVAYLETLVGAQDSKIWHSIPVPLASGEEIIATITQTTGSGRSFAWNLLRM